jgi:DNA-directed RNA polymerase specialized sigma24 family protein
MLGYDADTASRILGIKAVSVRVRLHRARTQLRELLGDEDA